MTKFNLRNKLNEKANVALDKASMFKEACVEPAVDLIEGYFQEHHDDFSPDKLELLIESLYETGYCKEDEVYDIFELRMGKPSFTTLEPFCEMHFVRGCFMAILMSKCFTIHERCKALSFLCETTNTFRDMIMDAVKKHQSGKELEFGDIEIPFNAVLAAEPYKALAVRIFTQSSEIKNAPDLYESAKHAEALEDQVTRIALNAVGSAFYDTDLGVHYIKQMTAALSFEDVFAPMANIDVEDFLKAPSSFREAAYLACDLASITASRNISLYARSCACKRDLEAK